MRKKKCEDLNLSECELQPDALTKLVYEKTLNPDKNLRLNTLNKINFSENKDLTSESWAILSKVWSLDSNSGLKSVNFNGCCLLLEDLENILDSMSKNMFIQEIFI